MTLSRFKTVFSTWKHGELPGDLSLLKINIIDVIVYHDYELNINILLFIQWELLNWTTNSNWMKYLVM